MKRFTIRIGSVVFVLLRSGSVAGAVTLRVVK